MSNFYKRAKELENEGNLDGALNYYEIVVEERSGPYDIRSDMGRVLNRLRKFEDAIDNFDTVLIMEDEHIESLFGIGISYLGLNDWKKAYEYFIKALKLDYENANLWYYTSIILLKFNHENESQVHYDKFLNLDNGQFKKIRSYYPFGLLFYEYEVQLKQLDKHFNIDGYINLLKVLGRNNQEILYDLSVCPLDILKEKLTIYNEEYNNNKEIQVIYEEFSKMGLNKDDVDGLLALQSIEDLKEKIISKTEINPFKFDNGLPEISLYDYFKSMPINHAYNYRIAEELEIEEIKKYIKQEDMYNKTSYKNSGILAKILKLFNHSKKQDKSHIKKPSDEIERKTKKSINQNFKRLNAAIYEGNYEYAEEIFSLINASDLTKFPDLKIKLIFYQALLIYLDEKDFYKALETLTNLGNNFRDLEDNFVYLYYKANILYDLGSYDESIMIYERLLNFNNLNNTYRDFINYLLSSSHYHKSDFNSAYESYKDISAKNQNKNVLNKISKN